MKLEIEVTEEEIKSAIERKVRTAIADQTNSYGTEQYIQKSVKENWQKAVDDMVVLYLADSEKLKAKIAEQVEKKLKAKINSVLAQASKGV
jgi:uncharacterized protein YaaW (UPF0174 family)